MFKSQIFPSYTFKGLADDIHLHMKAEDASKFDETGHEVSGFGVDRLGGLHVLLFAAPVLDHGYAQNGGRATSAANEGVNKNRPLNAFASTNVNEVQPALPSADFEQRLTTSRVTSLVPRDMLVELNESTVHHLRPILDLLVVVARPQKRLDCFHLVRDPHVKRSQSVCRISLVHIAHY